MEFLFALLFAPNLAECNDGMVGLVRLSIQRIGLETSLGYFWLSYTMTSCMAVPFPRK